ncbi:MAG: type II toxin-antitoxin system VapC family toxin [Candidatus Rokubacteria bacterium]|nr:type II toxin-antitoxin system VapC family toxin [Candidatus Rokubacteria bacterium]
MKFWDSSAVVPLLVEQASSPRASTWFAGDDGVVLWTLTPVEVVSAVRRLVREGTVDEGVAAAAETRMAELFAACHVIVDVEAVTPLAARLLRVHPLRAFDALQLAAAFHWVDGHPRGEGFHTLDRRLALAAQREGFAVPA